MLISSECGPTPHVMGAPKRWSEIIVAQFATAPRSGVKHGSVPSGSAMSRLAGAVVPSFKEQIAKGPVTLTEEHDAFSVDPRSCRPHHQAASLSTWPADFSSTWANRLIGNCGKHDPSG